MMSSHSLSPSPLFGAQPIAYCRRWALGDKERLRIFFSFQSEIVKRLSAIVGQVLPFLSQEHQQQVATAVERAKQVTMSELNSVIGVSEYYGKYK